MTQEEITEKLLAALDKLEAEFKAQGIQIAISIVFNERGTTEVGYFTSHKESILQEYFLEGALQALPAESADRILAEFAITKLSTKTPTVPESGTIN